ncbi:NUDIX hydrolase [Clostridium tarantellae]|uniref:NUDIX domain-containing protein n=1 Tax=Clostridium tarantellae TaxID=39493 RepID=A0A6I1MGT3_9CLOT|nr:NUDIX hydrolase [Clostridium tarantellae]MPQ42746.1 NUDIX domain-containing protein [Clostridium tarantellae]
MNLREETLNENIIYEGNILKLVNQEVKLPDENRAFREIVRHSGGVAIIAFIDDENILLVEQFRKPFDRNFLEIPAGKIDKNDIDYKIGALRELEEETGYSTQNIKFIGKIAPSPGFCDEEVNIYVAKNLYKRQILFKDEDEFLNLKVASLKHVKKMICKGKIIDAKTIAAIFFLENI